MSAGIFITADFHYAFSASFHYIEDTSSRGQLRAKCAAAAASWPLHFAIADLRFAAHAELHHVAPQ